MAAVAHQPNTWAACPKCGQHVHHDQWGVLRQCPFCGYYLRMTTEQRIKLIFDPATFTDESLELAAKNVLAIPVYDDQLQRAKDRTNQQEAVTVGIGDIKGQSTVAVIMDSQFMMGSLSVVTGRQIIHAYELATKRHLPICLFTASGGARMQEGVYALLQMSEILNHKQQFDETGLFSVSILTDPTMGGVSASFAFESDILIGESQAMIGFTGQRVIQKSTTESLPKGFQRAETLLKNGLIDAVWDRQEMATKLATLIKFHNSEVAS